MADFTQEEALFLHTIIKDALSNLHAARVKLAASDNMLDLMKTEEYLSVGESAWQKLKADIKRSI